MDISQVAEFPGAFLFVDGIRISSGVNQLGISLDLDVLSLPGISVRGGTLGDAV